VRYYIVVEGAASEKKVYPKWIPLVNANLVQIYDLADTRDNSFYLVSGDGYPNYLGIIENAIADMNSCGNFDCLVVGVDSEDMSCKAKYDEIKELLDGKLHNAQYKIIVQHFCLETWALGNRQACRKNAQDAVLLEYKRFFDVRTSDTELLPPYKDMNRAQFAFRYLRAMLRDWYPGALYVKSRPDAITEGSYFSQIKKRFEETRHIQSFGALLGAFKAVKE
jgi:hypothetical protein